MFLYIHYFTYDKLKNQLFVVFMLKKISNIVALVGDYHDAFVIVIHSLIIITANLEENPDKHSCLWEYCVSLTSL